MSDHLASERSIVLERIINAPVARVWQAWTDPVQNMQWWGPDGYTTTMIAHDTRVGGAWRFTMLGPDGMVYPNRLRFLEITENQRLVYDHDGDEGDSNPPFRVTVTFEGLGATTRITLATMLASKEARDAVLKFGADVLGMQTLAKLDRFVTGEVV